MTTAHVLETLPTLLHGQYCDCTACRALKGLRPVDPNDEMGLTCDEDGDW